MGQLQGMQGCSTRITLPSPPIKGGENKSPTKIKQASFISYLDFSKNTSTAAFLSSSVQSAGHFSGGIDLPAHS